MAQVIYLPAEPEHPLSRISRQMMQMFMQMGLNKQRQRFLEVSEAKAKGWTEQTPSLGTSPQVPSPQGGSGFTPPIFGEQGITSPTPYMPGMPSIGPGIPQRTPSPSTKFPIRTIGGKVYINQPPRGEVPKGYSWIWNKKNWELVAEKEARQPKTVKGKDFHWRWNAKTGEFTQTKVPVGGQKGPYKIGTIQNFKEGEKLIQKVYTEEGWQPTGKTAPRFESKSPKVPPKVRQAQALVLKFSKTVDPTVAALISMNPTMANSPIVKQAMQAGIPDDLKPAYQQAIKIIDEYYGVPQEQGLFSEGEITHEFRPGKGLVPVGR